MLAQYDPVRHGASALTYGQDHFVACASYLTLGLWFLGFTDEARRLSERAIEYARSLNHTHTLQFALAYAGALFAANCRDVEYLESTTAELLEIGKELGSPGWSAAVSGLHGKLLIERGRSSEGIAKLQAGITAFRKRRSPLWQPTFLTWLAEAHAAGGDIPQGLEALKIGQEIAAGGTHWMDAELHRGVGELLQIGVAADPAAQKPFYGGSRGCQIAIVTNAGIACRNEPCPAVEKPAAGHRRACLTAACLGVFHRGAWYRRSTRGGGAPAKHSVEAPAEVALRFTRGNRRDLVPPVPEDFRFPTQKQRGGPYRFVRPAGCPLREVGKQPRQEIRDNGQARLTPPIAQVDCSASCPRPRLVGLPRKRSFASDFWSCWRTGSRQLVEQRLCLFQIGGVEALGEPAVDRSEQIARFGSPALFAPQPGEARRGAQFIGLRLLPSRDAQCLFEGALALFEPVETEERDAFEAMKLRLPPALPVRSCSSSPSLTAARAAACSPCCVSASANRAKP